MLVGCSLPLSAGLYLPANFNGTTPWPGGEIPYVIDSALSPAQQVTYLDGLREYELAANVRFVPRIAQARHVLFKYSPTGPNLVSIVGQQVVVEISLLTRGQICHEMGHALGLEHEHQRPGRDAFVQVFYGNIVPGNNAPFDVIAGATAIGAYDFESVMHYGRDVLSIQPGLDTLQPTAAYQKFQRRLSNAALSPVDRATLAALYGTPVVPLSPVVSTTADGGIGSLRAAIYYATDHPGTTITFAIPETDPGFANGVFTIEPTGHLPPLVTDGTVIDASTQPGYVGKPRVFLDGSKLLPEAGPVPGLLFYEANCTVKALGFRSFPWNGISMLYPDATGNRVVSCSCGVDATGNAASPNAFQGVLIADGAQGNRIEDSHLAGNSQYGVFVTGTGTRDNVIAGNRIGTDQAGNAALGNFLGGVVLTGGAHHNTIGPGNVISGNDDAGVWITGGGTNDNAVRGNFIGLNTAGTAAVANSFAGLNILSGAANNTVADNVISGNLSEGMRLADSGTTGNQVYGNRVGTSPAGASAIPNGFVGVAVYGGATGNHIGGTEAGQGNVLSGNGSAGLAFGDAGTQGNFAFGNFIGTDSTGMAAVPNGFAGVFMAGGSSANFLGDGPATGNLISGNGSAGVLVADAATQGNFIRNNRIGPDALGQPVFSNQFDGIRIQSGSQSTRVGGSAPGAANVIRGNAGRGIAMFGAATVGHTFQRNSIYGNGGQGIELIAGNNAQVAPQLATAVLTTGTAVTGTLSGAAAGTGFIVEFFASPGARDFIGQHAVTTDAGGGASFSLTLPAIVAAGRALVATVTSQVTGDSSAFSNAVTVTSVDGDSDGLPDGYETITPGLNPALTADAALDNDKDGFSNLAEFVAGTDPNDSASRLLATGAVSGSGFVVSLVTRAGRFYRVDRAASPAGPWETVALHVAGNGAVVDVPVPRDPASARAFYRATAGE